MDIQIVKERNATVINTVTLGATKENGGTREKIIQVGGESGLPFLHFEGNTPNRPVIAMEVWDIYPDDWHESLKKSFTKEELSNPDVWARKCVEVYHADLIFLRILGVESHRDVDDINARVDLVGKILKAVNVPLAVVGCGNELIDNLLLPKVAEAYSGENLLLGYATTNNYKTIAAACMVHKHVLLAQSPLDINICKQLNILLDEMGVSLNKIIIDPSIGGLGYGIEYAYSIQERSRLGALQGDKVLAMPVLSTVGFEAWKAKEANASVEEFPNWGDQSERSILWEAMTATALLQAGNDILVLRHPESVSLIKRHIHDLLEQYEL